MNVLVAIPKSISLSYKDIEWIQTLDYEHVPFDTTSSMNMTISLETILSTSQ